MEILELISGLEKFLKPVTDEVISKTVYSSQALFNIKLVSTYTPPYLSINLKSNTELIVKIEATNNPRMGTAYLRLATINGNEIITDLIKVSSTSKPLSKLSDNIINYLQGKPAELN